MSTGQGPLTESAVAGREQAVQVPGCGSAPGDPGAGTVTTEDAHGGGLVHHDLVNGPAVHVLSLGAGMEPVACEHWNPGGTIVRHRLPDRAGIVQPRQPGAIGRACPAEKGVPT
ncbi:hypothetical protein AB0E04_48330 [Streptomyces sp. NPDC048251]|uniref:hypothetical protein n=1 Tax=Streptomyces sp. NPDC048251 TaxID=3154501 RepID=UPI00341CE85E